MDYVKVKEELKRGLEAAKQLRVLLAQLSQGKELHRNRTLMAYMTHQSSVILDTLDASISMLNNCRAHGVKRSYHSNRRSIQQRPVKTVDATVITEDRYSWRKYGQKTITKAKYPREYYRCGYKDQGCQVTKHVQIISENPTKYNITYYGQHTCQFLLNKHCQFHQLSACLENNFNSPNILSFEFSNAKHGLNQVHQDHRMIQQQHTSLLLDHDHGCAMPLSPCDQSSSSIISDVMINDHLFSPPMLIVDNSKYHVMEDLYVDEFDGGVQDIQLWDRL